MHTRCIHKIIHDCNERIYEDFHLREDNVKKQLKHNKLWSLWLIALSGGVFTLFLMLSLSHDLLIYLLTLPIKKMKNEPICLQLECRR